MGGVGPLWKRRVVPEWPKYRVSQNQAMPTADGALLVYLISVALLIAITAGIVQRCTRPSILPNGGVAAFEREKRVPMTLFTASWRDEAENAAVTMALSENEQQGLPPTVVGDIREQHAPSSAPADVSVAAGKPSAIGRLAKTRF